MVPFQLISRHVLPAMALGAVLSGPGLATEVDPDIADTVDLVEAYNETGLRLFAGLAGAQPGNLVLSPLSIGTALAMAYAGARGDTEAQMADVLGFGPAPADIGAINQRLMDLVTAKADGEDAEIALANALHLTAFGERVSPDYQALLQSAFGAELFAGSDLAAINDWVAGKTDGRITEILSQLDPMSVAVLLNAVSFSASWAEPFSAEATSPQDFHFATGETVPVDTMHQTLPLRVLRAKGYDALALPYAGGRLEMLIVMPMTGGLSSIDLSAEGFATLGEHLAQVAPRPTRLSLPRFSFDSGASLVALLQAQGLTLPFDADAADFSGVTGSDDEADRIHVSQAMHKAMIAVDEAGTEAAAATAIEFALRSAAPGLVDEEKIDRPFLFAIADRSSGALLFVGRVADPRAAGAVVADADVPTVDQSANQDETDLLGKILEPLMAESEVALSPSVAVAGRQMMVAAAPMMTGGGFMPGEGDVFATFEDGRTLSVLAEPVSTFSVDVDTASYSYVRRMLNEGALPQADAVRVEELINYFDYGYAGPESMDTPFVLHTSLFPTPWRQGTQLMRIGIQGFRVPAESRPPANIVFLVDTSGSMDAPDKLPLLKKSFEILLGQLTDEDTVSIVAYAGSAGIVLEPTKASDKVKIRAALNDLTPGGSTAGAEGIELAYQLAEQADTAAGTNRVILATDGDFNVGIDDPDALERFIAKKRDSGISLSVLGFGSGNLDDETMQALAQNGNGTAAYIDSFAEARKVLSAEVGASLVTLARDVKVQVEFNPAHVAEYRLIGYETRALNSEDFNNDAVDAGDIGSGHAVTALYEITPVGSDAILNDPLRYGDSATRPDDTGGELAFVKLRYKPGDADQSQLLAQPVHVADASLSVEEAPEDARFATAVAAFGQKLRDNPALAGWGWADIKALANAARGSDENGYRAELVRLIDLADTLDR